MGEYDAAVALARRLLKKKGVAQIVVTRPNQGAKNHIAGTRASAAPDQATFNVVGLPPGLSAAKEVGTLVGRRVMEFHMARTDGELEPRPGDRIPWKGEDWPVIWAANYDPAGDGLTYSKCYGEIGG